MEGVDEGATPPHEAVQIGCFDFRIAHRADAPISEVIGNHEQKIRALGGCRGPANGRNSKRGSDKSTPFHC